MADLVESAKALALRAHAGQVDKAGRPYIEHVARVAEAVRGDGNAEAVAWLHDVLEDCPHIADEFWTSFPAFTTRMVSYLTRCKGQRPALYYQRIRSNPIALKVKLADIADNSDPARLSLLDPATSGRLRRKYARALSALTGATGDGSHE